MNPLSPETRALLDATGDADRPTSEERARLRDALVTRLGIGTAVVATAAAVAHGAIAGTTAGSGTASTIGAASAGGGAAAGVGAATTIGAGGAGAATTVGAAGAVGVTKAVVAATGGLSLALKIAGVTVVTSAVAMAALSVSSPGVPSASPPAVAPLPRPTSPSRGVLATTEPAASVTNAVDDLPLTAMPSATQAEAPAAPGTVPSARLAAPPPLAVRPSSPGTSLAAASVLAEPIARASSPAAPLPAESSEPTADPPTAARTHGASDTSAPETTIAAETALLRRAHGLLVAGNATGALALLDEHGRTFPSGVLAEERDAERVAALCAAGQVERARAEATRFIAAHPGSAVASRVRRTCETR